MTEAEAEKEAERLMQQIDASPAASANVSRRTTLAYYEAIADHCSVCMDAIRDEMDDEEDEDDEE